LAEPTEQLSPFDAASPLDARYYLAGADFFRELSPFVSEAAAVRFFADVKTALVETLSEIGLCPPEVAQDVRGACAEVTPAEVYEEERRIAHAASGASARPGASTLPAGAAVGVGFIRRSSAYRSRLSHPAVQSPKITPADLRGQAPACSSVMRRFRWCDRNSQLATGAPRQALRPIHQSCRK
jgi:hypothetical protein